MFVSNFTKWTWFKIYLNFYITAYWKYILPRKNKLIFTYSIVLAIPLSFFLYSRNLPLVICFWIVILLAPIITTVQFIFLYSPKTIVCFREYPSNQEKEKIELSFKTNSSCAKQDVSCDFFRNTLDKTYDLLIETSDYYFVYKNYVKGLVTEPSTILVIYKQENFQTLSENKQNFLDFMRPKCKKYIKKT